MAEEVTQAAAELAAEMAVAEADAADADVTAAESSQTFDLQYVKSLRAEAAKYRREARDAQARAKEFEDQNKTESEKAIERAAEADKAAAAANSEASRLRVALIKGLTEEQAKRLVGDTVEELEADADSLIQLFGGQNDDQDGPNLSGTPRERLRPGAVPAAEPEETDPAKLAALVPKMYQ